MDKNRDNDDDERIVSLKILVNCGAPIVKKLFSCKIVRMRNVRGSDKFWWDAINVLLLDKMCTLRFEQNYKVVLGKFYIK